jgi:MFS family permease
VSTTERIDSDLVGMRAYRTLAANRPVRLLAVVSMLLAAGFYAQFETGLPAFALTSLHVDPTTVGTAAALNCVVIVALQWLVVRLTGRNPGAVLLAVVGTTWVLSWLLLEAALFTGVATANVIFVAAFGLFAVGETMYAPVLSPLAAAVAPDGMVGTTLGALAALRTGVSAAGPLVAGVLITTGLPHVFVLLHVAINAAAVVVAWRLWCAQREAAVEVDNGQTDLRSSRV